MTLAGVISAGILLMGCSTPAYAKVDPGWGGNVYVNRQEDTNNTGNTDGSSDTSQPSVSGTDQGQSQGQDQTQSQDQNQILDQDQTRSDNKDSDDRQDKDKTAAEPGFTTPGNGALGDQIKNSNGKDFYTIHTKNNNTFYLVIDHANSSENVYMLSLIDEDDLAEFLGEDTTKKTEVTTPPVILPETEKNPEESPQAKEPEPAPRSPLTMIYNNLGLIAIFVVGAGALYYFKIYKPKHEQNEEEYSEGLEVEDDGLPMESDE